VNGYVCFYKSKRIEVEAETSHQAQLKAAGILKLKKAYEITVMLAEKNGQPVVHSTSAI